MEKIHTDYYKDTHSFRANKAQAIAELAVFSSLFIFVFALLLQYGLQYNYQQETEMRAFRKALLKAYEGNGISSVSPPDPDNPPLAYLRADYVVFNDKPMPDLGNLFGFRERRPFYASSGQSWTYKLMTTLVADRTAYDVNNNRLIDDAEIPAAEAALRGNIKDPNANLPRVFYEVNGGIYGAGWENDPDKHECEYTTTGVVTYKYPADFDSIGIKIPDYQDSDHNGIYWHWYMVSNFNSLAVNDEGGEYKPKLPYVNEEGKSEI